MQLQELDEMKRRLKEMEEEAAALREMQAKVAKEMQGWESFPSVLPLLTLIKFATRVGLLGNFLLSCSCL